MKWFKHDTDCDLSEGLSFLIETEGWAGYGRWFRLLEIVASKMDKTPRCHAEYSIQKWCSLLGLKQKKLIWFLKQTENKLRTKVVRSENIIRIEIPNLLNKRDNYTKDLQVAGKKLPSKEVEVEVEVEVNNKNNKQGDVPDFINPEIWKAYLEMRASIKKPLKTQHQIKLAISTLEKLKSQGHNPNDVLNQSILNSWQGLFATHTNQNQTETLKPPETETLKAINKKLQGWNSEVEARWS